MPLMPAFHRRKKDAGAVGRLITGYGELELLLAMCAGAVVASRHKPLPNHNRVQHRTRYENLTIKRMFRIRGESNRINLAKKLMFKSFDREGMKAEYLDLMSAMQGCMRIRNTFAHCHWYQSKKRGLFFVDLEEASRKQGPLKYQVRHASAKTLNQLEAYFWNTIEWLGYLHEAYAFKTGLTLFQPPSGPKRMPGLNPNKILFPHKAPHGTG
jgi:hypothetical protein